MRRPLLTIVCALFLSPRLGAEAPSPGSDLPTITSIEDVRALDRSEAERGYPVRLQATVSHYSLKNYTALFVEDGTAGIWVSLQSAPRVPLDFGDLVEVEAVTNRGTFAPTLSSARVMVIGRGRLPEPHRVPYYELATGRYDSQWIEIEGIVQTMSTVGRLQGDIAVPGGIVRYNLGDIEAESLPPLVDARVRMRGACASTFTRTTGQLTGVVIYVSRTEHIVVVRSGPDDPYAREPQPLGRILQFSPVEATGHRIHVRGVGTASQRGRFVYLQDDTGGLRVESEDATERAVGHLVDAVGFATFVRGSRPKLAHASLRISGRRRIPEATPLGAEDVVSIEHDSTLVSLECQLLGTTVTQEGRILTLRMGETVFNAEVEGREASDRLASIVEGSELRVTGVYAYRPGPPASFRLHLPAPRGVVVTRAASWWRLGHSLVLAAALAAVLGAGGLWARSMNRKNRALEEAHGALTRTHAALVHTHEELEARTAELERFTYVVSHDLKSPLVTIRGYLGYVESDAREGDLARLEKDAQRIRRATERMNTLLDDLLELSRTGHIDRPHEEMPFGEVVREARSLVAGRLAQKGARVEVAPAAAEQTVRGDRARLVELMQNLLDNAIKFGGGRDEPPIAVGLRPGSGEEGPVFTVSDHGPGIDPSHHARIFDVFQKLDPETEGTGLGLALARRIVETHGGRIWVESDGQGLGATFCFTLPPTGALAPPASRSERGAG